MRANFSGESFLLAGEHSGAVFAGIDLTAGPRRPTACALLDSEARLIRLGKCRRDEDIVAFVRKARIAGVDAPCSLPLGLHVCCMADRPLCGCRQVNPFAGRQAERDLLKEGIRAYILSKNTFAKAWVRRGLLLKSRLERAGIRVLEVYPTGAKVRLFGRPEEKKSTRAGRSWLQSRLKAWVAGLPSPREGLLSHDALDAILAALSVWFYAMDVAEAVGDPREGQIWLPKSKLRPEDVLLPSL